MMKKVGAGIIGCGFISNFHARAYLADPRVTLVAMADVSEEAVEKAKQKWGVEVYTNIDYLLRRDDIDMVSICTPHPTHSEIVTKAAEAGKHILCEKPMCMTLKEADKMIDAARKSGVKFMLGFVNRFVLPFREAKDLIDDGAIGDVLTVYSHRLGMLPWSPWYFDPKKSSVGLLFDRFCYGIDFATWYSDSHVKKVHIEADALMYKDLREKFGEGFIDNAKILMRMENGVIASAVESYTKKLHYYEKVMVLGSDGLIDIDPFKHGMLTLYSERGSKAEGIYDGLVYPPGWSWPDLTIFPLQQKVVGAFIDEIRHFVDCLLEDKSPLITGEDGKMNVAVILATVKSLKTGKPMEVRV